MIKIQDMRGHDFRLLKNRAVDQTGRYATRTSLRASQEVAGMESDDETKSEDDSALLEDAKNKAEEVLSEFEL